jgi:PAS domain S-box-containing protein
MTRGAPQKAPDAQQLALLVEAVRDYAIFMLDPGGHVRTWNQGAARIKGYTAEEIIGSHFSRFYPPEDVEREHPQHELELALRDGRYEEEGWRVRKDGSRFWANVVITALHDADGTLIGFGKVTRDLTARRLGEEQLRANAAELLEANAELHQFRLLVSSVRDYAIFGLDAGGHIVTWNAGAEHIKGYHEAEAVGRHFSMFYTPEDRERNHPAHELEIAAREGRYEEDGWRVRKDGSRFWAGVLITALRNDYGTLLGFAKVTRDLTEQRAAEDALRDTAAELERFATAAAHELSEPLHTITGLADLAADRYGEALGTEGGEFLRHISDGARRLQARVDGLLEYSRGSRRELNWQTVRVGDTVQNVLDGLRARIDERGAAVVADLDALPSVRADPQMLEVVLQNLVANALKFSEDEPRVEIGAEAAEGEWCLWVADHGIGIPPEQQRAVFGLFERLHTPERYAGTGLGLALARRIVERHGGRMGVDSTPGAGSRFWFTLPAGD